MTPKAVIAAANDHRKWDGHVHVTDLIAGTREVYLKYTNEIHEEVENCVHKIAGIGLGMAIQKFAPEGTTEVRVEWGGVVGRMDLVEDGVIYDFKHVGAYTVKKALGLISYDEDVLDEHGFTQTYKSGKKKDQKKTRKAYRIDPDSVDLYPYDWQLNIYRFMLEQDGRNLGKKFTMSLQFFVRDGGTMAGSMHGVKNRYYDVDVPKITDSLIENFIKNQSQVLLDALDSDTLPGECQSDECWQGKKCESFCSVREICAEHGCSWLGVPPPEE